jgi:hypothetical protein
MAEPQGIVDPGDFENVNFLNVAMNFTQNGPEPRLEAYRRSEIRM